MKRRIIIAAIAMVLIVPALSAQTALTTAPGSRLGFNTGNLFGNDVDNFLDVNDYSTVEFEKFYALLQGGTNASISGGFAKNFGSIYLGLYYTGNIASGESVEEKDENGDWLAAAGTDDGFTFNNQVQILLGTPVGGFKFGLLLNDIDLDKDESTGSTVKTTDGTLGLAVTWGNNFSVGSGVIKPEFEVGYAFNMNTQKTTPKPSGSSSTDHRTGYSLLSLGVRGTYEMASQASLTVEEELNIRLYPDPVSEAGTTTTHQKGHHINNNLAAAFRKTYDLDDRFSVGWGAGFILDITSEKDKPETKTGSSTITADGEDTTTISISPLAGLGFVYKFIPDRFNLNGGVTIAWGFQNEKWVDNETNPAGTLDEMKTATLTALQPLQAALGGTFYITPQVFLDFSLGAGVAGDFFTVSPNANFLVSIKY